MKGWKRLLYYLVINVMVSACTIFGVLYIWENYLSPKYGVSALDLGTFIDTPTSNPTTLVAVLTPSPVITATQITPVTATSPPVDQGPEVVITAVFGVGDLETERVRIECHGEGEISLEGWHLRDEDGNVYTFPQLTLLSGGSVAVYTSGGRDEVRTLFWGLDQSVWSTGERVTLFDNQGQVRSTYQVP